MKRRFIKVIPVTPEAAADPAVVEWVRASMEEPWDVLGPRGGHYIADGPLESFDSRPADEVGDGFMRGNQNILFRAKREGRYIRP